MKPYYSDSEIELHRGDCLAVLRELPDASVDAVVTDPPYGLGFMGKEWDNAAALYRPPSAAAGDSPLARFRTGKGPAAVAFDGIAFQAWCIEWTAECLRVLKPGGHMLAFGGTRTWHRLACAVEDAGFEVRDSIAWMYGSGFPKSLNLTDDDGDRTGWGTALKPAFEPIIVARKPLVGTVAANVLAHGTGALNIDGSRVGDEERTTRGMSSLGVMHDDDWQPRDVSTTVSGRWPANVILDESQAETLDEQSGEMLGGNMPAKRNGIGYMAGGTGTEGEAVKLDGGGASRFFFIAREDNEPCPSTNDASTAANPSSRPSEPADSAPSDAATTACPDGERLTASPSTNGTLSASRPSDVPSTPTTASTASECSPDSPPARPTPTGNPASSVEPSQQTDTTTTTTSLSTSAGCADPATSDTMPSSAPGVPLDGLAERFRYVAKAPTDERPRVNGIAHPTTKPLALMRWLVRLVTPPGGTVLEPFAGSGTTVEACLLEGFRCIAIEREADYLPLIEARLARRRDPVRAIELAGEDGGLFDLLDGESA